MSSPQTRLHVQCTTIESGSSILLLLSILSKTIIIPHRRCRLALLQIRSSPRQSRPPQTTSARSSFHTNIDIDIDGTRGAHPRADDDFLARRRAPPLKGSRQSHRGDSLGAYSFRVIVRGFPPFLRLCLYILSSSSSSSSSPSPSCLGLQVQIQMVPPSAFSTLADFGVFFSSSRRRANCCASLDKNPPILTLQGGSNPVHAFLGFRPGRHIVSLSARDPADSRDMPPNNKDAISAYCIRGVKKASINNLSFFFFRISMSWYCALTFLLRSQPQCGARILRYASRTS